MTETAKRLAVRCQQFTVWRASEAFSSEVDGVHRHATAGLHSNGLDGEIFISSHKAGGATDVAARDAAKVMGRALNPLVAERPANWEPGS